MGTYGRTFTLSTSNKGLGAPSSGAGGPQPYTKEAGFIAYFEICDKINNGMTVIQDNSAQAPYGYAGNFWVGYDDASSLEYKVKNLIKGKGLAGAMIWALDLDDFDGSHCNVGKYPLIKAVKSDLESITTEQLATTKPTITEEILTTKPETTEMITTKEPGPSVPSRPSLSATTRIGHSTALVLQNTQLKILIPIYVHTLYMLLPRLSITSSKCMNGMILKCMRKFWLCEHKIPLLKFYLLLADGTMN